MGNTSIILVLLIIFHFSMATSSMNLPTKLTDQTALLAFKKHVIHDPKNVLATNWSASTPVCNWFGINCGSKHYRVTALNLSGLGLVGTIPPHLGNLSFLTLLSITNNSFHGRLPVELSDLRRLRHVDFGNNNFDGEIPLWFGSFTELRSLFLHDNNFEGVIPFSLGRLSKLETIDFTSNNLVGRIPNDMFDHLPRLKQLSLGRNQLSGTIPVNLCKCTELQVLALSRNQLEGSLPVEIRNLTKLQTIHIGRNHFEGEILRQIVNLTLLRRFDCAENNFSGPIPHQIGNLRNLEFLNLGENNFAGPIPPQVFNISTLSAISLVLNQLSGHLPSTMGRFLPNLKILYVGGNNFVGSFPTSISNASQLTRIDMSQNHISGSIPDTLGNLRNLVSLNIEANNLTSSRMSFLSSLTNCRGLLSLSFGNNPLIGGELPSVIGNLSSSLEEFYAALCNIKGSVPSEIGNLSRLVTIELGKNRLTGTIPTTFGGLEELQKFSLQQNELEGSIPSELCRLKKLSFLFLRSNKLSGPIPACLGDLISLRQLFLDSNMFSTSVPSTLTGLNELLILNLSSNSLTGPLPIDIGNWKVMMSMDFSNNRLSDDIPSGIAYLKDLVYVSLSNNRITGSIPESFGDLLNLKYLDMSRNNLTGEIPMSLEKLSYLQYFNVSFNKLEGQIPEKGPFRNYPIELFEGNEALCGAARFRVPSCKTRPLKDSKARSKFMIYVAVPIAFTILVLALIFIILRCRNRKEKPQTQEDSVSIGTWRRISYHELHRATDGFSERKLIGNGSYGSVYHGTLSNEMDIAVKVFNLDLQGASKSFDVECEVLRHTRHRNLVKIISSCSNDLDFKALVLELMPNGSLETWLHSDNQFLDLLQRLNILIDVASALQYLHHDHPTLVVHCDLKPSNVLLDKDMVAHLSDFGIAKLFDEGHSMIQTMTLATVGYMAPEYGTEGIVSTKGDVYSFGILTMETITRKKPTDQMFAEGKSLKSWVKESALPLENQVVETNLLSAGGKERPATSDCALSILQVALECCVELPNERLDMKEVVTKLRKIKVKFLEDIKPNKNRLVL